MESISLLKEQIRTKFLSGLISESEYQELTQTLENPLPYGILDSTIISQWIEKALNKYMNIIEDNDERGGGNQIIIKLQRLFVEIIERLSVDKEESLKHIKDSLDYEDIRKTDGHEGYNIYGYVYLYKFKIVEYSSYENGHSFSGVVNPDELQQAIDEFLSNIKKA